MFTGKVASSYLAIVFHPQLTFCLNWAEVNAFTSVFDKYGLQFEYASSRYFINKM